MKGSSPHKYTPKQFKTVTFASAALPKYRKKISKASFDSPNGRLSTAQLDISLIQAARDGIMEIVQCHLQGGISTNIHDFDEDGFTALHHAARYNRVKVMEALVTAGGDVNIKGGQDETRPLHMACRYNSDSVTAVLLSNGAIVNVRDLKGKTPLHYATRRGHDVVTKMLLSVSSCDVNAADNDQTTPLIMAAVQGNVRVCELLISRSADIMCRDINEMTALMWASGEGHCDVVDLLLKAAKRHGEKMLDQLIQACDNEGNTALHLAASNGHLAVCEILLKQYNAEVNAQKHNFATPLHLAATQGFVDICKLLVDEGGEVNKRDTEQMTPVHKAALYNKVNCIKLLMKHGGNINAKDKKNMSPLHHACWKGQTEVVEYLLENGAQIAEADSSLKTALHWTVQFGHYETLLVLLKHDNDAQLSKTLSIRNSRRSSIKIKTKNGGNNLLEASDKNDQTVLHYAAYIGNVSVLKTLLEASACTDSKDQEERTPLHIAAQYDNVNCVEALIEWSNQETNDDDIDGRTPLLLAALNGHHQTLVVLLSLGADVTKRDDEHCTALMLAAAKGHTLVMKILIEHHANVNDVDKMKNTSLHYACANGHVDVVRLLLDKRSDVTQKNTAEKTPLDLAIDNLHSEVTIVLLKHKSWRDSLGVRDSKGMTAFDKLIEKLPEAALVVLDHCVERTTRDEDDPTLSVVFDYQYLDPGPDDIACQKKRYFALNTMVKYDRDMLLSHPLCQNLLSQKWVRFGRKTFYVNLLIYLGYLLSLTCYVATVDQLITTDLLDDRNQCPIILNDTERKNQTLVAYYKKYGKLTAEERQYGTTQYVFNVFLLFFTFLFMFREIFKLWNQRLKYVLNFFNWIAWILMMSTIAFTSPTGTVPCLVQWRAGWIALFLAWINFIMYLRRIDFVGIYVIMFVTVLTSLLKAILVFFFFSGAFAASFYIILGGMEKRSDKPVFSNIFTAFLNIFVMTLGEIEFVDMFLPSSELNPFTADVYVLLFLFLFIMPIVLMNLMIGIAVGDIEKIQHNAYMRRIALQVDLLYQFENTMPKFMQSRNYVRRAMIKPNTIEATKCCNCFAKYKRKLFGGSEVMQFISDTHKDKTQKKIESISEEIRTQRTQIRNVNAQLQQHTTLLQQIAQKLEVGGPQFQCQNLLSAGPAEIVSVYDNLSLQHVPAGRTSSIRDHSTERPKSIYI